MLKWVKENIKKAFNIFTKPNIKPTKISDIDFIITCIKDGAKEGHFIPIEEKELRKNLKIIIE